jgi:histidinol-phosphate aminotransferase
MYGGKVEVPRYSPHLLGIPAFVGGRSVQEVQREYGLDEVIKLASNENPLGPSPLALKALQEAAASANRYDNDYYDLLRERLARMVDPELDKGHFIIGNGSFDVLRMVCMGFLQSGDSAMMSRATWHGYKILTKMHGADCVFVEPNGYRDDLKRMVEQITERTRLIFVCNPNNPTGAEPTQCEMDDLVRQVPPHVVVVFDEAYRDFAEGLDCPDAVDYIKQGCNVIITRTFSKLYGLANMRVGYGIARKELIEYLDLTHLPYHVSLLSLVAAAASLDDAEHVERCRQLNAQEKRYLYARFDELGLSYAPTQANFILLTDLKYNAKTICEAMCRRGVILRPMDTFGVRNAIRLTIGLPEENRKLIQALREVLEELKKSEGRSHRSEGVGCG